MIHVLVTLLRIEEVGFELMAENNEAINVYDVVKFSRNTLRFIELYIIIIIII